MPVYFAQIAGNGPIKIGFSKAVGNRVHMIGLWLPWEIKLLAAVPGTTRSEAFVQRKFAARHIRGEWFAASPDLLAFIEECAAARAIVGEPERLPPGPRRGVRGHPWTHGYAPQPGVPA